MEPEGTDQQWWWWGTAHSHGCHLFFYNKSTTPTRRRICILVKHNILLLSVQVAAHAMMQTWESLSGLKHVIIAGVPGEMDIYVAGHDGYFSYLCGHHVISHLGKLLWLPGRFSSSLVKLHMILSSNRMQNGTFISWARYNKPQMALGSKRAGPPCKLQHQWSTEDCGGGGVPSSCQRHMSSLARPLDEMRDNEKRWSTLKDLWVVEEHRMGIEPNLNQGPKPQLWPAAAWDSQQCVVIIELTSLAIHQPRSTAELHGWKVEVHRAEESCRRFVGASTTKLLWELEVRGQANNKSTFRSRRVNQSLAVATQDGPSEPTEPTDWTSWQVLLNASHCGLWSEQRASRQGEALRVGERWL